MNSSIKGEYIMEIEWGPEIEVDGVRPDWLTEPFPAWALDDPVVEKQFSQMIERHNKELDRIVSEMKRLMQPRDRDGRFISRRVEKAREIALELGRDDLVARLSR